MINIKKNKQNTLKMLFVVATTAIFLLTNVVASAQGDLLIFPKRLVFEGRNKVKKVILSNTGLDSATYSISFIEYRMNEDGGFESISEADEGQHFASPFLRVFPREVTLASGEGQTVKVQLYNTQNLTDGEYRSHLYFRSISKPVPRTAPKVNARGERILIDVSLSINLAAIYGISIACIIRSGNDTTKVSVSDMQFIKANEEQEDILSFKLNRNGNMSIYGDFRVKYITPNNNVYEVAKMKGVGIYTPGLYRNMKVKLTKPENVNFSEGVFKVIFTKNESRKVLAEAELKL